MSKLGNWITGLSLVAVFSMLFCGIFLLNMENPQEKSVEHVIYQINQYDQESILAFDVIDDTATVTVRKYIDNDTGSTIFTKKIPVKGIVNPIVKVYYSFDGGKTKDSYDIHSSFALYQRTVGSLSFYVDSNGDIWFIKNGVKEN